MTTTYRIIDYPHGARRVVAVLHGFGAVTERNIAFLTNGDPGTEIDGIIAHVRTRARLTGEYVDVERDGHCVAVVGPEGAVRTHRGD